VSAHSLEFRLSLLLQVVVGAVIVLFAGSAIWLSARTLERQEATFLTDASSLVIDDLEHEWSEDSDLGRAAAAALEEKVRPGVHVDVFDARGRLVQSTPDTLRRAHPGDVRESRVRLPRGAQVVTSVSTEPRRAAVRALVLALVLAALPLFGIVTLVSRAVARRALRPLSRMAAQAEQATEQGDLGPLGRSEDPAEVALLAASFNRLHARLSQMLQSEQAFSRDAAHELRTPLTVISGELEYARADPALSERQRIALTGAWEQVCIMTELVEALLLLRRTDPPAESATSVFIPVNLADLTRDVSRELLERSPQRTNDVIVESPDEVMVSGHPVLLASALRNLLSNAFKFTQPGQAVRVTVSERGGQSMVAVDDGGKGVSDAERERIFDAFYRDPEARATREGLGLGLPILRRVARAHGGDVLVGSSRLGGARFELSIPAWVPRS
jgi:two-component system, OmpR family, sensor kinase